MIFDNAVFIKPDTPFCREFSFENYAPVFRKRFSLAGVKNAKLYICALGIGYPYINGQKVSDDLFPAPMSNYMKTLWYKEYDVSHLLKTGENVITVFCGNGFFNEAIDTKSWGLEKAQWRDHPKVILRLEVDGKTALVSDPSFKCQNASATWFNQIRKGEYFNGNLYEENIAEIDYDDSAWPYAWKDYAPPTGVFRKCDCEPIRECEILEPVQVYKTGERKYLFDLGRNISGYIRLTVTGQKDDVLKIRYCEEVTEELQPCYNEMDVYPSYLQREGFQTDKFICSGREMTWSPRFTYHGFRYMEIDGITDIDATDVKGVFVHEDIPRRTEFRCSNPFLNQLFQAGIQSTYSNLFYSLTDCPTREKMAWTNDFMASAEQLLTNFAAEKMLKKYQQDIYDAMLPDGSLPGILPGAGWGYRFEMGPMGDGILFELPYRVYLHSGDDTMLKEALPYFERYFRYLDSKRDARGFVCFGLGDWAQPDNVDQTKDAEMEAAIINGALEYYFYTVAAIVDKEKNTEKAEQVKQFVIRNFLDTKGRCVVHKQCPVAMLLYYGLYEDMEPLKKQLVQLLEENAFHLSCGMVGIRRLLLALNRCGLPEYAYKVLTAEGYPGYKHWFDRGATSLYERWEPDRLYSSHNHHMLSDCLSWMIKTLAGITVQCDGTVSYQLDPVFIPELDFVECTYNGTQGKIAVRWERKDGKICLHVEKDADVPLYYKGTLLTGTNMVLTCN